MPDGLLDRSQAMNASTIPWLLFVVLLAGCTVSSELKTAHDHPASASAEETPNTLPVSVLLADAPAPHEANATEPASQPAEVYTCPMHPEVQSDKPGKCPKCGMKLKKRESPKAAEQSGSQHGGHQHD